MPDSYGGCAVQGGLLAGAINWKRGFYRAWIVLTVVWLLGALAILWAPLFGGKVLFEDYYRFSWDEPRAVRVTPLDAEFELFFTGKFPDGITETVLRSKDFQFHLMHASGASNADLAPAIDVVERALASIQETQDIARTSALPVLLAVLLGPPLLVLLAGLIAGWVAAGFGRSS